MDRRQFLSFAMSASVMSIAGGTPAWAQVPAVEQIVEALMPRRRRGASGAESPRDILDMVDRLQGIRRHRGLNLQEQEELFAATQSLPQIDLEVYFDFDKADITQRALPTLTNLGKALRSEAFQSSTIVIDGHTDAKGSAEYNQRLSERRASAVAQYLVGSHSADPKRLLATGYGFRKLKVPQNPLADVNRRVRVVNVPRG